jgi:hypothetical protein
MRTATALALALLSVGCSQSVATAPGPLPPLTLVRSAGTPPAPDALPTRFRRRFELCEGAPFRAATVEVAWTGARRAPEAWLLDVAAAVIEAPEGLVISVDPSPKLAGASLEANAAWIDVADLTFRCTRRRFQFPRQHDQSLMGLVQLKATGEASVNGTPWSPTEPTSP